MNIDGDGYRITYEDEALTLSGNLAMMLEDYRDIEIFFEKVLGSEPRALTLDIRNLEYLNSAGIKILCVNLILEAGDVDGLRLKILCSSRYTWQRETVPTFEDLMDDMEIVFE